MADVTPEEARALADRFMRMAEVGHDWRGRDWARVVRSLAAQVERLEQANANNLEGWGQDRAGLDRRLARLEAEREAILREAQGWAQEARTQAATVHDVGRVLGGIPCWGPIAAGVTDIIKERNQLRRKVRRLEASKRRRERKQARAQAQETTE